MSSLKRLVIVAACAMAGVAQADPSPAEGSAIATAPDAASGTVAGAASTPAAAVHAAVSSVPEPGTLGLLLAGLGVMAFIARRRPHAD
ncbi:MAG: PEP-CTERM sorting domain-containing protein [Aquabacterium sp.]